MSQVAHDSLRMRDVIAREHIEIKIRMHTHRIRMEKKSPLENIKSSNHHYAADATKDII